MLRRFGWLLVVVLLLGGCQSTDNGAELRLDQSPVAFRVGTQTVTIADFQARLRREVGTGIDELLAQGQSREEIEALAQAEGIKQTIFDNLLQEALLGWVARQEGLEIDVQSIDQTIATQANLAAPSENGPFRDTTAQRIEAARQQQVLAVIARYTTVDQFRARHILVTSEAEADAVLAELAAGADFATLARERSTDETSATEGGELPWAPPGEFIEPFEQAGFSLPLNTPTKVESEFGWHVIEVLERATARPFDDFSALSATRNGQVFYQESFLPWYEQLRQDVEATGELVISPGFDPAAVPLPFPEP